MRIADVAGPVVNMTQPKSLRHEYLNRPANQFITVIAKDGLSLAVCNRDPAGLVCDDNRIGGKLKECLELCLSLCGRLVSLIRDCARFAIVAHRVSLSCRTKQHSTMIGSMRMWCKCDICNSQEHETV